MTLTIRLPQRDRTFRTYAPASRDRYPASAPPPRSRVPLAAVHVVADPMADTTPAGPAVLDWEDTLAFRRYLWGLGLGVAEAMDTAQRGMGLDWETSRELIRRTVAEASAAGGRAVCGAQTDQLAPGSARSLRDVEAAYEEQCAHVEGVGGQVVLMASRELCRIARGPDDYLQVYGRVLSQLRRPALVHWLGEVFDPQLRGYWGHEDLDAASGVVLDLLGAHRERIEGIKLSLLDQRREVGRGHRNMRDLRFLAGNVQRRREPVQGDPGVDRAHRHDAGARQGG